MIHRIESPSGARMVVDGKSILNFGGCCYLGISQQPELIEAGVQALRTQGARGQIARHYGYALSVNLEAESAAEAFFDVEAAMYFSTGYLFGMIAMAGLKDDFGVIFLDEKAHYSLSDGALACGKPVYRFKHLDPEDLRRSLEEHLIPGQVPLVATDAMFPTFGSIPQLDKYYQVLETYRGWLVVDESHSFGVLGDRGRGAMEKFGLPWDRVVAGGSLAKAFCASGGLAIGKRQVIDALWKSHPARGAALGMSSGAAMTAASLTYLGNHPEQLVLLRRNIMYLKAGLRKLGFDVEDNESPIASFSMGSAEDMRSLQEKLLAEGILVYYSMYIGAGPEGVIRCAVFSDHRFEDIDRLLEAVGRHRGGH